MKYTITNEKIELSYFLLDQYLVFKRVVFNNKSFRATFEAVNKLAGIPIETRTSLNLSPMKFKYWYGAIFYGISIFCYTHLLDYYDRIFGFDEIEKFLKEAMGRGYDVTEPLEQLRLAKVDYYKRVQAGTEAGPWGLDKKQTLSRVKKILFFGLAFIIIITYLLFRLL